MGLFGKVKETVKRAINDTWDMSSKESREWQVKKEFENAKMFKEKTTQKFIELDNYYHNEHYTAEQVREWVVKKGINFIPPVLPDPFIQVESQIDPDVPSFQFNGRQDLDKNKAKEREAVVEFVCYNNKLEDMNTENERINNKFGNAFWKVSFNGNIKGPGYIGDIVIGNPHPANIFPGESAYDLDDCESFNYAYRMHRRAARREFGKIIDSIPNDSNHAETEIFSRNTEGQTTSLTDETIQIVEHWFKDDEGDIACTIQANNVEVKFIPKYWINTKDSGNKNYPFVKYCKTPVEKSFWDKGEIEAIQDLVEAGDREFLNALLNDSLCGNDIILEEEDVYANGFRPTMEPGARWTLKTNKMGKVQRLGGLSTSSNTLNMIEFIHNKIQETNGNYDANMGDAPPANVKTLGGMAIMQENGNKRARIKKTDRNGGFRRLYELIDWTILEFYNQDRVLMIKDPDPSVKDRQPYSFNSENFKAFDDTTGEQYYPRIDCEINIGEGIKANKAFTLTATDQLSKTPINPGNAEIIKSEVDIMDLPNKQVIKDSIDKAVQMMQPPQQTMQQQMPSGTPDMDPQEFMQMIFDKMTPEEQQAFMNAPDDQKQLMLHDEIQQHMSGR
jgi:hypothetical protein